MNDVIAHYDLLIDEGNDPVRDPESLREYMDKWDGQRFIHDLGLTEEKTVLEIGVGTGRLAVRTAPACKSCWGIDLSAKTVDRARENLVDCGTVKLLCGDFLAAEFDESFDVIYSSLTFMHIEEKEAALRKAAALLKKGGRFVLSIDNNPADRIDMGTRCVVIYPDDPAEMADCILAAGLHMVKRYRTEFATVFVAEKETGEG